MGPRDGRQRPVEVWTEGPRFDPPTYRELETRARGDKQCQVPMIFFRYANGVVVKLDKGSGGGAIFYTEKGKLDLSRKGEHQSAGNRRGDSSRGQGADQNHVKNWLDCIRREKTGGRRGDRPSLNYGGSSGQYRPMDRPAASLGSGE